MRRSAHVAVLLLWWITGICSATPLVITDQQGVIALGPYSEFLVDDDRSLTLEQVLSRTDFENVATPALNFSFTRSRIWLRFRIDNPLPETRQRILDVRYFLLDDVILYAPDGEGQYQRFPNGRRYLAETDNPHSRFFNFTLTLPPNSSQTYYLAVDSFDSLALPLLLSTPEQQQQYRIHDTVFMTLYAGLILSTIFFAVFMLATLRERVFVYYLGFLLFHHLIALMLMEGIPTAVFGITDTFITQELIVLSINVAILMAVLFMRSFLRLQVVNLNLYHVSHGLVGVLGLSILLTLTVPHFYAIIITTVACMIVGAGILFCCAVQMPTQQEARHFMLAWSAGIIGATIYGLKVFDLLPVTLFSSYAWHVGTVLEAILFSFTIARRVDTERKQRLNAQTELTERERALRLTQEQLLHAETAAKTELEARVRERTRDISRILAELEQENKVLVELSINDGLTRVRNRRFFNDVYAQLWHDAVEQQRWLSLILLDIDHFKKLNDQYGHLMGDRCLVVVASLLKQWVNRPGDVVCRYGGEEFVLVLPDTEPEAARWVAERLRKRISEAVVEFDHAGVSITASFGVAGMIPEKGLDPEKLIAQADIALYRAKQEGRNRVMVGERPATPDNVAQLHRRQQD
ncbi:MAG: diguanylate cyclase [Gammaproteobacteria bacterium]